MGNSFVQNSPVGIAHELLTGSPLPVMEPPDFSRGVFATEKDRAHDVSKALGGFGFPLGGLGSALLSKLSKLKKCVSAPRTALRSADEVYGGVRQASQMMRDMGISRSVRKQVMQSFDVRTLRVRTAGDAEFGIRYFDNIDAFPRGRFLFETFPASRNSLALQTQWNQMTGLKQWQIRPGATVFEGATSPQGIWRGGQTQKYIFDPARDLLEP